MIEITQILAENIVWKEDLSHLEGIRRNFHVLLSGPFPDDFL